MTTRQQSLLIPEIPHLRRYAIVLTRDRDGAEDLLQSCLERALKRLHLWRSEQKLRPWLFAIMHNLYIDQLRRGRERLAAGTMEEAGAEPGVEATQELTLEVKTVLRAMEALPPDQRAALLLVGVEQFTYAEAAEVLAVPIGTLMSRLHRARQSLREKLRMDGPRPAPRQVKRG